MADRARRSRAAGLTVSIGGALALAGCGGGDGREGLTVSAASSLAQAFQAYGGTLADPVHYSFGGSGELAAQIEQGARPDVFASASTNYPRELHQDGLVEDPVRFARNQLVLAVARGESGIRSVRDLTRPGLTLVIGAKGVPAGDYAREALGRLPAGEREAILANVRSEEPAVTGIIGKLEQGAADAGFVYASDVRAASGAVRGLKLPNALRPNVTYAAAVVKGSQDPRAASAFVRGLLADGGARDLDEAGFKPPPGR